MRTIIDRPTAEHLLELVSLCFTREAAERLVALRADLKTQARIDDLAARCNDGRLTPEERAEYETFVSTGTFISILQAKARKTLTETPA